MPDFERLLGVQIDVKRMRGRMAEERITMREVARAADLSYWTVCDILEERRAPGLAARLRLAAFAQESSWDDVVLYPADARP